MRIAIVTLFTGEIADYGEIGAANKQAYARRHGYDCFVYRERLDRSRHPSWSKLDAINRHLPDHDWVFWTDADSLIMNTDRTLESIILGHEDKDMILTWEVGKSPVNAGQWLVRNTTWSAAALSAIGHVACPNARPKWFEQGALIDWLGADETRWSHLAILHPRVMNSTPPVAKYNLSVRRSRFRHGDFIIHFWPLARRREEVRDMMLRYDELSKRRPSRFATALPLSLIVRNRTAFIVNEMARALSRLRQFARNPSRTWRSFASGASGGHGRRIDEQRR